MRKCKCGVELQTKAHTCKDCAREYMKTWRKNNLDKGLPKHHVYNYKWRVNNPEKYILQSAKGRAKERGWTFEITIEDIHIPEFCPILGEKLIIQSGNGSSPFSPSLDRIDSTKGYIKGNVRVISWRANNLKSNGTLEEFKLLVENWDAS